MRAERLRTGWMSLAVLLAVALSGGCGGGATEPAAISADDMCAGCKMAISEKRYAAQFIDGDGETYKFDDIGCMVSREDETRNELGIAARFVMDYDTLEWIDADEAFFVHSSELRTPMGSGLAAFKEKARAEAASQKYHGRLVGLDEAKRGEP
jgi:copper chaperone NosL